MKAIIIMIYYYLGSDQMHGYSDLGGNETSLSSLQGPPTGPCTPLSYLGNYSNQGPRLQT